MKLLTVSAGQLEIARSALRQPFLTVGRSPSCDVLLRAPGVQAIHFLIEWIGTGEFDPNQGMWSITDISKGDSAEGIVFSERPVTTSGFTFTCIQDRLESTDTIGGGIVENIGTKVVAKSEILELIQVRTDSGAIEEVKHVRVHHGKRKERLLPTAKEFKIEWSGRNDSNSLVNILLEEMPGAEIFNRGQRIQSRGVCEVKPHDILQIRWRSRDFFVRLVDEVKSPPIPRDLFGDALLRKLILSVGMLGVLFILMLRVFPVKPREEEKPPLRVARVEIPVPKETPKPLETPKPQEAPKPQETPKPAETKTPPPEHPKPTPKPKEQSLETPAQKKPEKAKDKIKDAVTAPGKSGGQAVAPRFKSPDKKTEVKAGLNSPAEVTDVNAVGILGALKKMGPKGKGVRADKIVNDAIVTEAVSGAGASKVVLKNPPAGTLGTGSSGSPNGKHSSELGSASTTLSGVGNYDAGSIGPVAVKGGSSEFKIGSKEKGSGTGGQTSLGSIDAADFTVEGGGLDRETVRRVISSYKGQIRTCYERALLTQSNLEGRIVYDWRIGADGPVLTAQMVKSTVGSSNLASCVLDVIKQMAFPKAASGRSTRVIYPFVFQGRK